MSLCLMGSHDEVTLNISLNKLAILGTLLYLEKNIINKCLLSLINNSIQVLKLLTFRAYTNMLIIRHLYLSFSFLSGSQMILGDVKGFNNNK